MADDLSGIISSYFLSTSDPSCSQVPKMSCSDITLCKSSMDVDSKEQTDANFQSRDTLQSLVQSFFSCKDSLRSNGKPFRLPCKNMSEANQVGFQPNISSISRKHSYESGALTKKKRIRWTQDLHNRFIQCVDRLGGAKKATPKGILKLMNSDGLTIFHVKSHLQKYRVTEDIPESTKGKACACSTPKLDPEMGIQIVEALRLQVDVQRHLCEQLESQRKLLLRIEEQAKQLQEMFDSQMETKSQ